MPTLMQPSEKQIQQLKQLRMFRDRSPTVGHYVRRGLKTYLYLILVGGLGVGLSLWAHWPSVSSLFAGMVSATVLRDLGWYRRIVGSWPLTQEITNWQRVDELLAEVSAGPDN